MRPRGRGPSIPHLYPVSLSDYGTDTKPQKPGAASSSLNFHLSAPLPPTKLPSLFNAPLHLYPQDFRMDMGMESNWVREFVFGVQSLSPVRSAGPKESLASGLTKGEAQVPSSLTLVPSSSQFRAAISRS